jgi:hypothetical protein
VCSSGYAATDTSSENRQNSSSKGLAAHELSYVSELLTALARPLVGCMPTNASCMAHKRGRTVA